MFCEGVNGGRRIITVWCEDFYKFLFILNDWALHSFSAYEKGDRRETPMTRNGFRSSKANINVCKGEEIHSYITCHLRRSKRKPKNQKMAKGLHFCLSTMRGEEEG